jgi:hypothetical protein
MIMKFFCSDGVQGIDGGRGVPRGRIHAFWISSASSTIMFLLLICWAAMLQFPRGQFPPAPGLLICSLLVILSGAALLIGLWDFNGGNAPIMIWPLGPLLGILVGLEFVLSATGVCQMIRKILHLF